MTVLDVEKLHLAAVTEVAKLEKEFASQDEVLARKKQEITRLAGQNERLDEKIVKLKRKKEQLKRVDEQLKRKKEQLERERRNSSRERMQEIWGNLHELGLGKSEKEMLLLACNTESKTTLQTEYDVNYAMEVPRKSRLAFAAANLRKEEAQYKEVITSVKTAVDFSFQDVEGLLHLVRLAMEAIGR